MPVPGSTTQRQKIACPVCDKPVATKWSSLGDVLYAHTDQTTGRQCAGSETDPLVTEAKQIAADHDAADDRIRATLATTRPSRTADDDDVWRIHADQDAAAFNAQVEADALYDADYR
jgi:hypothetical protein